MKNKKPTKLADKIVLDMLTAIRSLTPRQLKRIAALKTECSPSNCWWAIYHAKEALSYFAQDELNGIDFVKTQDKKQREFKKAIRVQKKSHK
jgi:hypothetical protein